MTLMVALRNSARRSMQPFVAMWVPAGFAGVTASSVAGTTPQGCWNTNIAFIPRCATGRGNLGEPFEELSGLPYLNF
jgi:hypothetical protein